MVYSQIIKKVHFGNESGRGYSRHSSAVKPSRPVGQLGTQAYLCPPRPPASCFPGRNFSLHDTSPIPNGSVKQLLIREITEEPSKNNSVVLRQGPGPSSRNVDNNIFEFGCRTKTPNKWKMLMKHPLFLKEDHQTPGHQLWKQCKLASTRILIWGPVFRSPNCNTISQSLPRVGGGQTQALRH